MNRYPQCHDCKYFKKSKPRNICTRFFQGRFLEDTMTFGICKYYIPKKIRRKK